MIRPKVIHREKPVEFVLTNENLDRVYQLTANGLTKEEVAGCFGVTLKTFDKWIRKHREVRTALGDGRYFGLQNATTRLRSNIDDGNVSSIIFYLKTRWRWREERPGDATSLQPAQKQDKIVFTSLSPTEAARVYQQLMKGDK
jgi:hypothetical protein